MARRKQSISPDDPARPRPPESLLQPGGPVFLPAPEVEAWLRGVFLARAGSLFNEEHSHLDS
ncbi:MAG: hypothetical protein K2Q10_11770, partial [Rhodospirillales bacterium]|nr:hypothetical protein [Rhodospirillales bacterium]